MVKATANEYQKQKQCIIEWTTAVAKFVVKILHKLSQSELVITIVFIVLQQQNADDAINGIIICKLVAAHTHTYTPMGT